MRQAEAAEKLVMWKDEYGAKTAAQLEAEITKLNDPKYLAGKSKEAAAGRDPNSAALARVQLEGARLALKEKQEESKLPAAVKDEIAGLRELLKGKSAIIDKATVEGMASPEGIAKLEAEKSAIGARISQLRNNYLPESLRTKTVGSETSGKPWEKHGGTSSVAPAATKAAAPTKAVAPAAPPEKEYEPPPDSPAGKRKAAIADRERQANSDALLNQEQANAAYSAALKDPRAALELQGGPLFRYLSRDQKATIFKVVRGN